MVIVIVGGVPGAPTDGPPHKEADEIFHLIKQGAILPIVTTITGNGGSNTTTTNGNSPSQPGGRC